MAKHTLHGNIMEIVMATSPKGDSAHKTSMLKESDAYVLKY